MLKIKAILKLAVSICFRSFIVPTFHIVSTVEKSVKKIEFDRSFGQSYAHSTVKYYDILVNTVFTF